MGLPGWAQGLIALATLFGASSVLWMKVVRPVIRIGAETEQLKRRIDELERRVDGR